jgi:predicted SAM-dependent methyltransferase
VLGKLSRYLKRLVFLPWNFHKLFLAFTDVQAALQRQEQALHANQAAVGELQLAVEQQDEVLQGKLQRQDEALREGKQTVQRLLSEQLMLMTDEVWRLRAHHTEQCGTLFEQVREQGRLQQQLHQRIAQSCEAVTEQLCEQGRQLQRLRDQHSERCDALAADFREHDRVLQLWADDQEQQAQNRLRQQLAESQEIRAQFRWLQQLAEAEQGLNNWIGLLQRKLEAIALDLRERVHCVPENGAVAEPCIVNPPKYQERLTRMGDHIRINLGCGEICLPDYINIDLRQVAEVDVIADVRRLPFEPSSLAEIASAHLVEHFRQHHFMSVLLPYWKSLLRPDGILRIVCPNWAAMLRHLQEGKMTLADFKYVTFGAQDYAGDDHFSMYTPESLSEVLRQVGFEQIEVVAEERQNGLCPEMELVARLQYSGLHPVDLDAKTSAS